MFDRGILQDVLPVSTTENIRILSGFPIQHISTGPAIELVVPVSAKELIAPLVPTQDIRTQPAIEEVIIAATRDPIDKTRSGQSIRSRGACDFNAAREQFSDGQRGAIGKLNRINRGSPCLQAVKNLNRIAGHPGTNG